MSFWAEQEYWEHTYEDVLDVIAKMPEVAALIYRCKFKDGKVKKDLSLDYTGNYCSMMGYHDKSFQDLMRLYLVIHSVRVIAVAWRAEREQKHTASIAYHAQAEYVANVALCRETVYTRKQVLRESFLAPRSSLYAQASTKRVCLVRSVSLSLM